MIQQINLYPFEDTDDRRLYANRYTLAVATLCSALTIIGVVHWQRLSTLEARQQQLSAQLQQTTSQILLLQANSPSQQNDALLNQELQHSQATYQSLAHVVERLSNDQTDQSRGFSRYLTALAEHADRNVWLSRIHINAQTHEIMLAGTSTAAAAIPAMLQRLQQSSAFSGHRFGHLTIQQSASNPAHVDFTVSSTQETAKETQSAR